MRITFLSVSTFVITMCLFAATAVSAATWVEQDVGTQQSLRGIAQAESGRLIAVGNSGNMMYSDDEGDSWVAYDNTANNWWHDVLLEPDGDLIVVGDSGGYIRSDDDGETWTNLSLGVSTNLRATDRTEGYGYIVGDDGTVLYYSDATSTWTAGVSNVSETLYALHDYGDGTALAVGGGGRLVWAASSGLSWTDLGRVGTEDLYGVHFESEQVGWIVGTSGTLKKTEDGRSSWSDVSIDGLSDQDLFAIEVDGDNMAVVGDQIVLTSTDGGETWEAHDYSDDFYEFHDAHYSGDGKLWVVGTDFDVWSSVWMYDFGVLEAPASVGYFTLTVGDETTTEIIWSEVEGAASYVMTLDDQEALDVGDVTAYEVDLENGEHTVSVYAVDASGAAGEVNEYSFTFEDATEEEELEEGAAETGNLLTLTCEEEADASDPCRAVYYYADDGKRHAFPNERVFFTWFDDFEDVVEVSSDFMSSLALGANVTYHPGTMMVKFQTVPTVYAVAAGGELRAIDSEEVAEALYGTDWNQQIDDISDVFLGNYSFGEDIVDAEDYDVDAAVASVQSLDDNF